MRFRLIDVFWSLALTGLVFAAVYLAVPYLPHRDGSVLDLLVASSILLCVLPGLLFIVLDQCSAQKRKELTIWFCARFRFSLKTMFLVVTVVAIELGIIVFVVRRQEEPVHHDSRKQPATVNALVTTPPFSPHTRYRDASNRKASPPLPGHRVLKRQPTTALLDRNI